MKRPPRIAAVLRILGCCHDSLLATLSDISAFFFLKNFAIQIADIFCHSYLSYIDERLQDFSSSRKDLCKLKEISSLLPSILSLV